jgi:5-methylcytosine-specific restriction enzyme subunit McrC
MYDKQRLHQHLVHYKKDFITSHWENEKFKWEAIKCFQDHYRLLIGICQLVIEGMLLTTESGEWKLASFLKPDAMSRLYEKFILEFYRQEYPQLKVEASQIPWAVDDGMRAMLPMMQTDITISSGEKVLIIDAKYYTRNTQVQHDREKVHSHNLYQIFTYVKNKDAA